MIEIIDHLVKMMTTTTLESLSNMDHNNSDLDHDHHTSMAMTTSTISSPLLSSILNTTISNSSKLINKLSTTTLPSSMIINDDEAMMMTIDDNDDHMVNSDDTNILIESWNRSGFQLPDINTLPTPIIILSIIAIVFILWMVIKFIQALWTFFICYMLGFGAKWRPGSDSWAIITGSTDGIGLAYAKAMAKKGYCVFLLSRNQQKLDKVKADILNECPKCPQVKTMAVDFTLDTIYKHISDEIHALNGHVHVLINNVGMAYKYPEYFTKIPNSDQFITNILNCNILSVTRMTHIILPIMEARRSGIIINVASYSALFPTPFLAIYSASKIYMDYFSRALHSEYSDRGIVVQSVLPYYVSTNMIRNPTISFMIPSPDQFVHSALKTVGVETRTYGYFAHNVLAFFQSFIVKFIIGNNLNTKIAYFRMKRLRKGCYKRKGLSHYV